MPFNSFAPNTVIKSADINTNFGNAVHKTDAQLITNKVNVPASIALSPSASGTATCDLSLYNWFTINMPAGNITIAVSNATVGQPFVIEILQDGGGSRTVTWFTTIKWPLGVAPTLTTTASKKDTFGFKVASAGNYEGYIIGQSL